MTKAELFKRMVGTKFFTVEFTKKDGQHRVLNGRLGVKKYLKGGEKTYDTDALDYVTVYDIKAKGYRTLNLNTCTTIKAGKQSHYFPF